MPEVQQAVILAGGRGTRLGSLTSHTPKPMLSVGGMPFLEHLLFQVKSQGVREVLLCVGYLANCIQAHFGDGHRLGLRIDYTVESEPAGTGGPLVLSRGRLADCFFVLNGDSMFCVHFQTLLEKLVEQPSALATIALREVSDIARYGGVRMEGEQIIRFDEKGGSGPGLMNGGIYCCRKSVVNSLPPPPCSLEKDLFPQLAGRRQLLGERFSGYFADIGVPESLRQIRDEPPPWMNQREPMATPP